MKNEQKKEQTPSTTPERKPKKKLFEHGPIFTAENLLKFGKGRGGRIISAIIAVLVLIGCFYWAHDYTRNLIGDGAYKYSDDAYTYIEESIKNYLGPDGPDIVSLQESIPYYTSTYENGVTTLTCVLQDGFFQAVVVAEIATTVTEDSQAEGSQKSFHLVKSERNFNSLQEYQDYFWHTFKVETIKFAALAFAVIAVIWLVSTSLILFVLKKVVEKKANSKAKAGAEASKVTADTSVTPAVVS